MKTVFNWITSISLRFRYITLLLAVVLLVLGGVAASQLNQELLPPIEFPQTVVLAQTSGMTSDQVLNVITERIEPALGEIDEVINLESTTTGSFGSVIVAYNDFGIDIEALRDDIRQAINDTWLPIRTLEAPDEQDPETFAAELIQQLPPDAILYLAQQDSNFLFQLSPDVWEILSEDSLRAALGYLAQTTSRSEADRSALEVIVDKEVIPQLRSIAEVANVDVTGGQTLPGEDNTAPAPTVDTSATSLLLTLSPDVWTVVQSRIDGLDDLDESAVESLRQPDLTVPAEAPALPADWSANSGDYFTTSDDLLEITSSSYSLADVFNDFYDLGRIAGPLGTTADLTPEIARQLLEIDPSFASAFEADQLSALDPAVLDVLLEFGITLDGLTRDELAASALAQAITGQTAERMPVPLPDAWRVQPPRLIQFSSADIPLAAFSIASTGELAADASTDAAADTTAPDVVGSDDSTDDTETSDGPALPPAFGGLGAFIGVEMNTADDLIDITLPEDTADQLGFDTISAADVMNLIVGFSDPSTLPAGVELPEVPVTIDPEMFIGQLSPDAASYLADNDPEFVSGLLPVTREYLSEDVLALPAFVPQLGDAWTTLSNQPQFATMPLRTAADLIALSETGRASDILNRINAILSEDSASSGALNYESFSVRLIDSLSVAAVDYFEENEPEFFSRLDTDVLLKMSPDVLATLDGDFRDSLDEDVSAQIETIVANPEQSAFGQIQAELYATDTIPARDDAPPLNPEWQTIAGFIEGVREFNNAFDLFRFPQATGSPAQFINGLFDGRGRSFAQGMLSNLSLEAFNYIVEEDATYDREVDFVNDLRPEAILLLPDEIKETLPEGVIERAEAGGVFTPTNLITRTNQNASLQLVIYKDAEANTVSTFAEVEEVLTRLDEENENITIEVAFEQSTFVEESISGVAREGGLGAVFAVVIILMFLSGGVWAMKPRRTAGLIMLVVFLVLLAVLIGLQLDGADGDIGTAFANADVVFRVLLIVGVIASVVILLWPGDVPDPAWRATIVIAVSIPLSILMAFIFMRWGSPAMHDLIQPLAEDSEFFAFILRLFPETLTLNIMTLSGLTVAVGRVVDDSIVVLENIFRQLQAGGDKKEAILSGTRDVSAAIFVATLIAVVVFLPLGLTGGIIGAFFLPFGLAVTYALAGSFMVAVTVVPALAFLFIRLDDMPEESDLWMARYYLPALKWALSSWGSRATVIVLAILSMMFGFFLLGQRPAAFLPNFGEPQVSISVEMPPTTGILETNALVAEMEQTIVDTMPEDVRVSIQTTVGGSGGGGFADLFGGSTVTENIAAIVVTLNASPDEVDMWTQSLRASAEEVFGPDNASVSSLSLADGGFGGFALVVSGDLDSLSADELIALDERVIDTLNSVEGLTNVSSNLSENVEAASASSETFIRVNESPAISYSAELETDDTIGITQTAIDAITELPDLPEGVEVSQGFSSEMQTEGFQNMIVAIGIAFVMVILILAVTYRSAVYWIAIIFSVFVAPVGAAIALTISDRVLGISALIGLLMLLGLVITNAVVLIDRVRSNRKERDMELRDALIEAGGRRLRPIMMTSLATIIALIPLAIGLSEGAIIAAELGTVVIGGVFSSTLLTLIVVPVMYSLLAPVHRGLTRLVGLKPGNE